jgi:hypothetical protein
MARFQGPRSYDEAQHRASKLTPQRTALDALALMLKFHHPRWNRLLRTLLPVALTPSAVMRVGEAKRAVREARYYCMFNH